MTNILIGLVIGLLIGLLIKISKKSKKSSDESSAINDAKNNELSSKINELTSQISEQKQIFINEKEKLIRDNEDIIRNKELEFKEEEKRIREDAIKKSKSVMLGKMWEQIVPHYRPTDFTFTPSDARFIGAPVDFIIFEGSSESDIKEVIFLEIKTSKSRLNSQQSKLKKLIDSLNSKLVRWETINIPTDMDKSINSEE